MKRLDVYCTACDAELRVRLPNASATTVAPGDIECPHAELCSPDCVLVSDGTVHGELLEFLPRAGTAGVGPGRRGMKEASRLVEDARRASLTRERRRWIRWWGGR
jgi:hypothetical protein